MPAKGFSASGDRPPCRNGSAPPPRRFNPRSKKTHRPDPATRALSPPSDIAYGAPREGLEIDPGKGLARAALLLGDESVAPARRRCRNPAAPVPPARWISRRPSSHERMTCLGFALGLHGFFPEFPRPGARSASNADDGCRPVTQEPPLWGSGPGWSRRVSPAPSRS